MDRGSEDMHMCNVIAALKGKPSEERREEGRNCGGLGVYFVLSTNPDKSGCSAFLYLPALVSGGFVSFL